MKKITELKNIKSENYLRLKEYVLSAEFAWYYNNSSVTIIEEETSDEDHINFPFLSHIVVSRPRPSWSKSFEECNLKLIPEITSNVISLVYPFLEEIVSVNNLQVNTFLRVNLNCTFPTKGNKLSIVHVDHPFEHKVLIVYFTNSGGETIMYDESDRAHIHFPEEDDIIIFDGQSHCNRSPKEDRRVVLVATFL